MADYIAPGIPVLITSCSATAGTAAVYPVAFTSLGNIYRDIQFSVVAKSSNPDAIVFKVQGSPDGTGVISAGPTTNAPYTVAASLAAYDSAPAGALNAVPYWRVQIAASSATATNSKVTGSIYVYGTPIAGKLG